MQRSSLVRRGQSRRRRMLVGAMLRRAPVVIAGVLMATIGAGAWAGTDIYKWTDENGNVYFSDKEPPGADAEIVNIHYSEPSAEAQQKLKTAIEEDEQAKEKRLKTQEDQAREARNLATKKRNCEKAQAQLAVLQRVVRLFHTDKTGNRVRVGEDERQADIKKTQAVIKENCKG